VRNTVCVGFCFLFAPLLYVGVFTHPNASLVMLAKAAYDAFRMCAYAVKVHRGLTDEYKELASHVAQPLFSPQDGKLQ
jgi:hypothetical protein